jgi:outer membrane protein TolC
MQLYMNVNKINLSQLAVINVDFTKPDYFGKYYIEEPIDSIFTKALNNDTEFKVLGVIKINAEEKKRLAQKGKWDVFATTGGRYNYYDLKAGARQGNFLVADAGLQVKLYDHTVLKNTIAKAQADISAIEYTIEDRKKLIKSDIEKLKDGLTKKKEQLINSLESLDSWNKIYSSKKRLYVSGKESVDNFIQSFRSLVTTEENRYNLENNYLDLIRDFDYICGTYFEYIELKN